MHYSRLRLILTCVNGEITLRIVLINPCDITVLKGIPSTRFTIGTPLGLAYIAAVLEEAGHEICVIDCVGSKLNWAEMCKALNASDPDMIGITTMTHTLTSAIELAKKSKEFFPRVPVVFGGHGVFTLEDTILKRFKDVNIIVRGEGETTIVELAEAIETNRPFDGILGACFRSESGNVTMNPPRPLIQDLDSMPFPARHMFPMKSYIREYFPGELGKESFNGAVLVSSRGCPYRCVFCATPKFYRHKWRPRSPENVVNEIEHLYENYGKFGLNGFYIADDNFLVDQSRVMEICDLMIERGLSHLRWVCQARVDSADPSLYTKMYEAGCCLLELGVESGNDGVLKMIQKGITKDMVRRAVGIAKSVGLRTLGYFMFGLPGDTEDSMMETMKFAEELDFDAVQFNPTFVFPGTDIEKGRNIDWFNFLIEDELLKNPCPRTELHPCVPTYADREHMKEIMNYVVSRWRIKEVKRKRWLSIFFGGLVHPKKALKYILYYLQLKKDRP